MKALHCGEKSLRTVVNLNDERFKVKDDAFYLMEIIVDTKCTDGSPVKVSNKRKRVTFSETTKKTTEADERRTVIGKDLKKKYSAIILDRTLVNSKEFEKNIICGRTGEGILNTENNGNILFLSLIEARRNIYTASNDHAKFQEVRQVMKLMKEISPSSKFVQYDNNINQEFKELSWEDAMERTIHVFCNANFKPSQNASRSEPSDVIADDIQHQNVKLEPLHFEPTDILDVPDNVPSTECKNELGTLTSKDSIGDDEGVNMTFEYKDDDFLDGLLFEENEQYLPDNTDYIHSILV